MKLSTHELLWTSSSVGHSELRTTRGLLIGAAVEMGGSWQCVLLGSIIAVRPDEDSAQRAITDALAVLEAPPRRCSHEGCSATIATERCPIGCDADNMVCLINARDGENAS